MSGEQVGSDAPHNAVSNPHHYTHASITPIDAIEAWGLNFSLGNAVKYIARHEHKGVPLQDLKKAQWYLRREIERLEETGEQQ